MLLLAAVALALVAAGCGGDGKKAPSKAEFLRKGNAICAAGNREIDAGAKKMFGTGNNKRPSASQIKEFATDVALPSVERQVAQLKKLTPPKGDEDKVKEILDAADQGLAKAKQDPSSLAAESGGPFERANQLANAYGLRVCGS